MVKQRPRNARSGPPSRLDLPTFASETSEVASLLNVSHAAVPLKEEGGNVAKRTFSSTSPSVRSWSWISKLN